MSDASSGESGETGLCFAPTGSGLRLQHARNENESPLITHYSSLATRYSPLTTHRLIFISALGLIVLSGFLFFYRLCDRDLWSSHEGRAAQDAETILEDGNWGLPRLFDRKYVDLQKPPLYYWLVAAVALIRGQPVDAWAVRLPSALAAAGCVFLLYWFGIHRGRSRAALLAALILATAVHFTWLARIGRIDMPLTLAISFALICFYMGWQAFKSSILGLARGADATPLATGADTTRLAKIHLRPKKAWPWFLAAYLSIALAVLLKGPIGLVLPVAVAAIWLLTEGELPLPWRIRSWLNLAHRLGLWWGLPLVFIIAGPWFFLGRF